jgi:hypothetical protein
MHEIGFNSGDVIKVSGSNLFSERRQKPRAPLDGHHATARTNQPREIQRRKSWSRAEITDDSALNDPSIIPRTMHFIAPYTMLEAKASDLIIVRSEDIVALCISTRWDRLRVTASHARVVAAATSRKRIMRQRTIKNSTH